MNNFWEKQLALAWFEQRGIKAYETDDNIYIRVDDYDIQISTSEIMFRADLYKESLNDLEP